MLKRILIVAYLAGNLGDDLFVQILLERYPDEKFEMICPREFQESFKSYSNLKLLPESLAIRMIRKFSVKCSLSTILTRYKAVVEIGGSIFQQTSPGELVSKQRSFLSKNLPYFVIGSNFGPYLNQEYLESYCDFLKKINGAVFRDQRSYRYFSDLTNVSYAPDVIFGLNVDTLTTKYASSNPTILIIPIDLRNEFRVNAHALSLFADAYVRKLAELIQLYSKTGFNVRMLSFSDVEGDSKAISEIFSLLPPSCRNLVQVSDATTTRDKVAEIRDANYIIGTRFHAMILSWIFNKPSLIISYNEKTSNVQADLFPQQYLMSIDDFCDAQIDLDLFNAMSKEKITELRLSSIEQFKYLDEFIRTSLH